MEITKKELKRKIQEYEAFTGDNPALGKCTGFLDFIKMDLKILSEMALKRQGGRKPIPFSKDEFNQLWEHINNN